MDVSHYDGAINWTNTRNSGIAFGWAKATEYASTTDDTFVANVTHAKAVGVYIGAYHFAHPESDSPVTEADFFWSVAGPYIKNDGVTIQPMLDFETFGGVTGASSYADWANQWCNEVISKAAAAGVTVHPVIYCSTCGAGNLTAALNGNTIPWIANPSGGPSQTGTPWTGGCTTSGYEIWGSGAWTVWQYSWTTAVPGIPISGGGDVDVFNGTLAQLVTTLVVGTTPPPLRVTVAPQVYRSLDIGSSLSVTGMVSGFPPYAYQWLLNGTNIPGATTNVYRITSMQLTNAGNYSLILTNTSGSVTSSPVTVFVYPLQVTMFSDNFDSNTATNWIYNTSSSDNAVTFNFDYSTVGVPSAPHSTGGTTRGVEMQANLSAGAVSALSISPTNQSFAGDYRVHFDAWINVNGPYPGGGAGSTEYLTGGIGTGGRVAEWSSNPFADGYYFSIDGDGGVADTSTTLADVNVYNGPTAQLVGTGVYSAGKDPSARGNENGYYEAVFSAGKGAPTAQKNIYKEQTNTLDQGTFGMAWHDVIVSKRGTTVEWVVDGARFAAFTNATLVSSNVFVGFWDPFSSLSGSNVVNFGLVDNVRVESPATLPIFTLQPVAQTVPLGTNVTFTAAATGLPSPVYQWQLNGTNILNATNTSYSIAFVATTNAGNYSVSITNVMGKVTSTNALLALVAPAAAQFSSITTTAGDGTVQVGFNGTAYWTYTIEVSTNLTSWNSLTNVTSASGLFNVAVSSVTNAPQQFFRARVGP